MIKQDALSMDVALPAVIFLLAGIPFYWMLVWLFEIGILNFKLGKRQRSGSAQRADVVNKHG